MYSYVEENEKEQLKIVRVTFNNFHFEGNEVEKPLKVDRGTPGFGKHSWNKIGIHCALQNKGKGNHSCNLSNNVIGNTALDTKGLLPCAFGHYSYSYSFSYYYYYY